MIPLKEIYDALPIERREKIEQRAAQLIAEEMTMRGLREARKVSRSKLARKLGVDQEQVSRREQETDLHIAALRRSVEALGGKLSLIAEFPDGAPVAIDGFRTIADSGPVEEQPVSTAPRKRSRKSPCPEPLQYTAAPQLLYSPKNEL